MNPSENPRTEAFVEERQNIEKHSDSSRGGKKRQFSQFAEGITDQIAQEMKGDATKSHKEKKNNMKGGGKKAWRTVVENCSSYLR